jgi:hypothetical protein
VVAGRQRLMSLQQGCRWALGLPVAIPGAGQHVPRWHAARCGRARRGSSTRGKQIHHPLIGGEKRCAQSPATNPNWGLFGLRVTLCRRGPTELGSADRLRWAWCSYCLGEFRQADSSFDFAKSSAGGSWSSKCHSRWVAAYLAQSETREGLIRNKGRFDYGVSVQL